MRLLLLALCYGFVQGNRLDQAQPEMRTSMKMPLTGIWQSFVPSISSNLTRVSLMVGPHDNAAQCIPFRGQLGIYEGEGRVQYPFFDSKSELHVQDVEASCSCDTEQCLDWQSWDIQTSVPLLAGHQYALSLSASSSVIKTSPHRVGVMVADAYPFGRNNFQVDGYDYAFKTFMAVEEQPVEVEDKNDDFIAELKGVTKTHFIAGVGATVAVLAVLAVVLVRRRQRRHEAAFVHPMPASPAAQSKSWYSTDEAVEEWKRRFELLADGREWDEDNAALDAAEAAHDGSPARKWTSSAGTTSMSSERPSVKRNTLLNPEQGPEGLVRKVNTLVDPSSKGGKSVELTTADLDEELLHSLDLDELDMLEDNMMFEMAESSSA
eukprot:m.22935 g.22935  ORF g.22935 m.22935 type:complete len:378 (-) comp11306_c0_seq1:71-1204(-)